MDNQHKKITGYRDLSQEEIDLMNEVKAKGAELEALCNKVQHSIYLQEGDTNYERHSEAQPKRWLAIARTDFQTGLMALTRAVAQPLSF